MMAPKAADNTVPFKLYHFRPLCQDFVRMIK